MSSLERRLGTERLKGRALPMTGCLGSPLISCGGTCRLRRRCRPAVVAAATDGEASSRWVATVCPALLVAAAALLACLSNWSSSISSRRSISSISSIPAPLAARRSSTRRAARIRRRRRSCTTATVTTMSSRRSPSCRLSSPASSLTELPDRPWPMDLVSFQVEPSPTFITFLMPNTVSTTR